MKPNVLAAASATLFALMCSVPLPLSAREAKAKPLASYRHKNRVLLVFASGHKDASYQEQMKLWQNEKAGFEDRQLVIVSVLADGQGNTADEPATLVKRFGVAPDAFKVVLVGKDGHNAYGSAKPIPADTLYGRIDAMPMRREEMKRPPTR